ncbi:Wsp signal transduction system regulator diguanylate cyclase WspR [Pseudomonas putida]|uniref:Wsp signal transduction system regulator diguanylate cyclase WspR n=1 Tax=Pseudomonas putida TaxID=303 RepID=UPI000DB005BC|nr:Wsp signal transduction system regulator diguanylate cyclase WspR [Pseudomonas putida]MBI6942227.1 Wsp signal transduction system regulator diguanylate cyclase WspR [Pseudomonas putida]MBI6958385.1 Wsp signal transduction system regulator diguanylate cyclase WspR [Pseudomonas putida]PZQ40762.1 MAG: diguanylate cyclase response regulator [Pseudomonas putida]
MNDLPMDGFATTNENSAMVLLVDDQAMIGEAVRRGLAHEENIDFHFCADPHQAVAQAMRIKPTVILQDLIMPGLDGLTLVREYRNNPATQDIPIIVLSTKEDPLVKSAAFAAGANDYLVKLPDTIELVARIRYHSRSYLTLLQRDEAYRALRVSQQQLLDTNLMLQRLMNSDGLTGLSNRRHFDEYLELEWRRAMREQQQLSLLMIDVDYFKVYNDSFGHLAGDEALRQVAEAIRGSCSRPTDLPARYGGEEFALVLPNTSPGGARLVAEKLRQTVHGLAIPHTAPQADSRLTVSIGLATQTPPQGSHCRQLISAADKGLYLAKDSGRNQVGIA